MASASFHQKDYWEIQDTGKQGYKSTKSTEKCKHGDLLQVLIFIGTVVKGKKEIGFREKQIKCSDEILFFSSNEK